MHKIQKLRATPGKEWLTPSKEEHTPGEVTPNKNLPVDYTVEVELDSPIEVGKSMVGSRTKRNGVEVLGIFASSPVVKVDGNIVETGNSVYYVEQL